MHAPLRHESLHARVARAWRCPRTRSCVANCSRARCSCAALSAHAFLRRELFMHAHARAELRARRIIALGCARAAAILTESELFRARSTNENRNHGHSPREPRPPRALGMLDERVKSRAAIRTKIFLFRALIDVEQLGIYRLMDQCRTPSLQRVTFLPFQICKVMTLVTGALEFWPHGGYSASQLTELA